ncbi:hypothetical protein FEDK69T_30150 [Flavobacterium enshiense DK69]|uniref:Uncharacterized protein n=2 Tax=Flavobacterium TaxID=237 RepID=V6S7W2_9FLAO|nr:hypothetical protein FEDK69T_30150 [Flavobacterium enshiense DK69]KGO95964.1 hypothetical protein Q767_08415 [Flavobacterium enshiense DK69]
MLISIFVLSCEENKKSENKISENIGVIKTENNQNEDLKKQITEFITWYGKNEKKLHEFELVNNSYNEIIDSTKFYSVNFENTEKYLSEFRKSGLFSERYIENQRRYFKECEKNLIAYPENDGPPSGFDHDIVMKSQDFVMEELIRDLKVENVQILNKTAKLTANFGYDYKLQITLSEENKIWKIDNIERLGFEEN